MHLALVDGASFLYRAHHSHKSLTNPKTGVPNGAAYGFCSMLMGLIIVPDPRGPVTHAAVAWDDPSGIYWRHKKLPSYKANRSAVNPDRSSDRSIINAQLPIIEEFLDTVGLTQVLCQSLEADDVIAAYTTAAAFAGKVTIYSVDKDLAQLADMPAVVIVNTQTGRRMDQEGVFMNYGIHPYQMPDFLALAGDPSDNLIGFPGIGKMTAIDLLRRYGTLKNILDHAEEIEGPSRTAILQDRYHQEMAFLVRDLADLSKCPVKMPVFELDRCKTSGFDYQKLRNFFLKHDFPSLEAKIQGLERLKRDETPLFEA